MTGHPDLDLGLADCPKRYVHGLALRDMFTTFVGELRAHPRVEVYLHDTEVVDVERHGARLRLRVACGEFFSADQVLLVTGHTHHEPRRCARARALADFAGRTGATYVPHAYPLDRALPASAGVVAVGGMGLTAIDVVLFLTEGRGGGFAPDPEHGLRYVPSGAEPARLVAFSETGLFTFTRPDNRKESGTTSLEHRGVFLTMEAIDRLREVAGTPSVTTGGLRQLDFERDVLPLVVLEMAFLHYVTLFGPRVEDFLVARLSTVYRAHLAGGRAAGAANPARLLDSLEDAVDEIATVLEDVLGGRRSLPDAEAGVSGWSPAQALSRWGEVVFGRADVVALSRDPGALRRAACSWTSPWRLEPSPHGNRFDWERTLTPVAPGEYRTPTEYRAAVLDFMDRDQLWATQGNLDNPHKAAADGVWRDLRPVIAYAVDDGGLTPASHRNFVARFTRVHNRLANGAALEVMARVRALVRHGVLDVGAGPGAAAVPDPTTGRFRVDGPVTGLSCQVDTLIDARVHPFDPHRDASPLFRNLLGHGAVRLWCNASPAGESFEPGGLDLTDRFHPVGDDGTVDERITVLGPPGEGRRSFLLSALRPGRDHYVMRDVLTWLSDFWRFAEHAGPHHTPASSCPGDLTEEFSWTLPSTSQTPSR